MRRAFPLGHPFENATGGSRCQHRTPSKDAGPSTRCSAFSRDHLPPVDPPVLAFDALGLLRHLLQNGVWYSSCIELDINDAPFIEGDILRLIAESLVVEAERS